MCEIMEEIEKVKKFTNWQNVKKESSAEYKFYFEVSLHEVKPIDNIKYFYYDPIDDYVIAVAANKFYIGVWHKDKEIHCFGESNSLKEICESL